MSIKNTFRTIIVLVSIFSIFSSVGCNESITGSPMVFSIDKAGFIRNRDQYLAGHYITEADVITISLNTLFIRYIKQEMALGGNQLLVYSEVYDSPEDATPYSTIIFNQKYQPQNAVLGVVDRVIYGPVKFKGYPIRIRLYVVELDKKDNELAKRILRSIGEAASTAQPHLSPAVGAGVALGNILCAFNEDDYELRIDITFHPMSAVTKKTKLDPNDLGVPCDDDRSKKYRQLENAQNLPLRSGHYLISKVETEKRVRADDISVMYEYLPAHYFEYSEEDRRAILIYKGGYLWLDKYKKKSEEDEYFLDVTEKYTEKTYAILAIRHGGQEGDKQKMQAIADEEFKAIEGILQQDNHQDILKDLESIGKSVAVNLTTRQIVNALNNQVAKQPDFRKNPEFLRKYVRQLVNKEDGGKGERTVGEMGERYAIKLNASLLRIIESTCINFPLSSFLDADNWERIGQIKKEVEEESRITLKEGTEGLFIWSKKSDL